MPTEMTYAAAVVIAAGGDVSRARHIHAAIIERVGIGHEFGTREELFDVIEAVRGDIERGDA